MVLSIALAERGLVCRARPANQNSEPQILNPEPSTLNPRPKGSTWKTLQKEGIPRPAQEKKDFDFFEDSEASGSEGEQSPDDEEARTPFPRLSRPPPRPPPPPPPPPPPQTQQKTPQKKNQPKKPTNKQ